MTFSWKKKIRRNGFSKLVADLQSPKHGGSLVVETGFPTSLIDLYVRNRGRFRKSNANKQQSGNDLNTVVANDLNSCDEKDEILEEDVGDGECEIENEKCEIESVKCSEVESDEIIEEIENEICEIESVKLIENEICEIESVKFSEVGSEKCGEIEVEKSVEMAKLNPVYAVLLKVLLIMVLVLGTKRFKVEITVSAFVLFLLELIGKPFLGRSSFIRRSSVDSEMPIESSNAESSKKNKIRNTTDVVSKEVLEIEEQVESKQVVRSEEALDEVRSEGSVEIRHKGSRRAIMKSRMKKLVPKKLRRSSVGPKDEILSCTSKEVKERVRCDQDVKPLVVSSLRSDSKGATFCIARQEQDEIVEIGRFSSSTMASESDCKESMEQEREHNSGYLVLCLIVLAGLIGGRVLALVLALSWCLMMTKIQWRNVKFPIC
ncbi:hypothetical protein CTI12_AA331230 [Artemisia annua]|uniref:Uncharacterized protein n=1 Tax=Artemisia annua TaxID=35608 RepID=A0A2U1MWL7_ARTAN|nr:hypothetical protein CTI12_AA331230 [Artemisia annua]